MKIQKVSATTHASPFRVNEMFFSTTDARGVITSGNEVFARTSGYSLEELIGEPHNLIRHPDMPRQVFAQLWQTLAKKELFRGYVKNQSRNGDYYWVFAVIVPLAEGYLSVRFKPSQTGVSTISLLYKEMMAAEAAAAAEGVSEATIAAASAPVLARALQNLGCASYEAFSDQALNREIMHRDRALQAEALRLFPDAIGQDGTCDSGLGDLFRESQAAYATLNDLFSKLDGFSSLAQGIQAKARGVLTLADDFRFHSINSHIASEPLGQSGATLGTIARFLSEHSATLGRDIASLSGHIKKTMQAVEAIASNLSAARLLLEISLFFQAELAQQENAANASALGRLEEGFSLTLNRATQAFTALQRHLPAIEINNQTLRKDVIALQVAQISGLTESSRLAGADGLRVMFVTFRDQIEKASDELRGLSDVVKQLATLTRTTPPKIEAIAASMERIHRAITLVQA